MKNMVYLSEKERRLKSRNISQREYLELTIDIQLDDVLEMQSLGMPIRHQKVILALKHIKSEVIKVFNVDDVKLHSLMRKLSRKGKAGRKKGSRRKLTPHQKVYVEFRNEGHGHFFAPYIEYCEKKQISQKFRYKEDSFDKIPRDIKTLARQGNPKIKER